MRTTIYLLLMMPFLCLGQINIVPLDNSETIGKIAPMGQTIIECLKDDNTYTFIYKDVKFTTINAYESFSFKDIDDAFNSLFNTIMDGLTEKRKDDIIIELPDGQGVLFLNFTKAMGVSSVQFAHAPYKDVDVDVMKYSRFLTKKNIKKLFGKK